STEMVCVCLADAGAKLCHKVRNEPGKARKNKNASACGPTAGNKMGLEPMMRQATVGQDGWANATASSSSLSSKGTPVMSDSPSEAQRELWNRIRARLKAAVGEDVFTSWFARLELEELVEDTVHLSQPTRFLCSWVQSNYADQILEAFRHDVPEVARLQVTLRVNGQARPRLAPAVEAPAAPEAAAAQPASAAPAATSAPTPRLVRDAAKGDALAGSAI